MSSDAEELRAAIREGHELLRDLKVARKELMAALEEAKHEMHKGFHELVEKEISDGLASYKKTILTAIEDATETVYQRFDRLADIMLGEDRKSKRIGKPTMAEMAATLRRHRDA